MPHQLAASGYAQDEPKPADTVSRHQKYWSFFNLLLHGCVIKPGARGIEGLSFTSGPCHVISLESSEQRLLLYIYEPRALPVTWPAL